MDPDNKLGALPQPQPGHEARRKLVAMAVSALVLLAAMTYWLSRDEGTKQDILTQASDALQTTGLAPLIDTTKELLTPSPPPQVGIASPGVSASGTSIQGTVADAASTQPAENVSEKPDASPPGVMPPQREDSVIRPAFVRDLAQWLVTRYKPSPQGAKGQINISLQAVNMRYGMYLRGMERKSKDPAGSRAHILRYAFNPAMLEALYNLYADRLVQELTQTALAPNQGKALHKAQLDDLYHAYAAFFADLAVATGGLAAMPDLPERIANINRANNQTIALHRQLTENVFALDEARETKHTADIHSIEARIENLNWRYRASLQGQSNARAALVSAIRNNGHSRTLLLDDDSLLFLALWIDRRMGKQTDALAAVRKASALLADLSRRFEQAGNASRKPAGTR